MPRRCATAGGICPVSPSVDCRPVKTRSTEPIFSIALANIFPVANVSEPAILSSDTRTPLSAPMAIPSRIASAAVAIPMEIRVTVPPTLSLTAKAASIACKSTGFNIDGAPIRTRLLVFGSSSISETDGTCLTNTAIFIFIPPC